VTSETQDPIKRPRAAYAVGLGHARRAGPIALASAGLLLLLGSLATAILLSQQQTKSHILSTFGLRGTSSAGFVATDVAAQASRQEQTAARFLAAKRLDPDRFPVIASTFGSDAAVLLDNRGRLLDVVPRKRSLIGSSIASRYPHLKAAEAGRVAVSNIVPSAATGEPVMAVAVPYPSRVGRRVFSVALSPSGLALNALVDHTISYRQHQVFLVDADNRLLAASPRTSATTLAAVDPQLARAAAHSSRGSVGGARTPTTFTSAPVPGTSWRLLIAVPDSRLYMSIAGWTLLVPWLVFSLVTILGVLLLGLYARSLADRTRLKALSAAMQRTAQTDSLTLLYNRRALTEQLTRAAAHARRLDTPLSVLMLDLDRFKQTNDSFGHDAGDQVLCTIADCMREALRADDVYGRWGGDEFLVVLPSTGEDGARVTAQRLRDAARAVELPEIGLPDGISLSVGVASAIHAAPADLVRQADLRLYEAKAALNKTVDTTR